MIGFAADRPTDEAQQPTETVTSTSTEQTVTSTPTDEPATSTPTDETTPKQDGSLKMGAKMDIVDAGKNLHMTVQAVEYQQPYKGPQPQAPENFQGGDVWATAEVKVCNVDGASITVSQFPWSLAYKDGTSIGITGSSGGDMPKPEFPMDKTLKSGRCAAGLIAFPVSGENTPEFVVYDPEEGEPAEWAINKG
ncbi:DUF4352 domain-containing protein [Streptomyces sp. NPDC050704]|uniref:DUF4352 domain-containing protein n=1 Tax=Streptomyces sp. NPDC050704 TaxID=3157219 RepID=UPI00341C6274